MTVTILASVFLALLLALAVIGLRMGTRRTPTVEELSMEKCSVCRSKVNKSQLIERQVGDHKLLYFCPSCIQSLHEELTSRN